MFNLGYRNFYLDKMEQASDGTEGGAGGASGDAADGADDAGSVAGEGDGLGSDPFSGFDLDAFLQYDPMKKEPAATGEGEGGMETPPAEGTSEGAQTTPPAEESAPPAETAPTNTAAAPTPQDLELHVLRQQLAEMQKMVQGQQAQAPAEVASRDPELEKLYAPSPAYTQLTMPPQIAEQIFSSDPETARQGLNTAFQGLAHIIHQNVAEQARQREQLLAERLVEQAQQPWRQEQQQRENKNLHDSFYSKYPELDKPEIKPYIAMKAKQVAEQMGIQQPTQQFLDWVAQNVKQELGLGTAAAPTNPAPNAPNTQLAQNTPPPYMAGNGSGRAPSKPAAKDDIFDTLFVG